MHRHILPHIDKILLIWYTEKVEFYKFIFLIYIGLQECPHYMKSLKQKIKIFGEIANKKLEVQI